MDLEEELTTSTTEKKETLKQGLSSLPGGLMETRICRVCKKPFNARWKKQLQCSTRCSQKAHKMGLPKVRDGKLPPKRAQRVVRKNKQEKELRTKYKDVPEVLTAIEGSDELMELIRAQMVDDRNNMAGTEHSHMYHLDALAEEI